MTLWALLPLRLCGCREGAPAEGLRPSGTPEKLAVVHQAEAERRVRVSQSVVDQNAVEQSAHQVELDEALLCEFFLLPARSGPTDLAPLSDWAVQHNRDLVLKRSGSGTA